jgi:hypothetical protein
MRSTEPRNGSVISLEALRCVTWPRNDDTVSTVQLTYKVTVGTRECRSYWSITVHMYAWYPGLCGPDPSLSNHTWRSQQNVIYYQGKFINFVHIQTTTMDNTIYIYSGYYFGLIGKAELVTWRFINCVVRGGGLGINIWLAQKKCLI